MLTIGLGRFFLRKKGSLPACLGSEKPNRSHKFLSFYKSTTNRKVWIHRDKSMTGTVFLQFFPFSELVQFAASGITWWNELMMVWDAVLVVSPRMVLKHTSVSFSPARKEQLAVEPQSIPCAVVLFRCDIGVFRENPFSCFFFLYFLPSHFPRIGGFKLTECSEEWWANSRSDWMMESLTGSHSNSGTGFHNPVSWL